MMQSVARIAISIFLLASAVVGAYHNGAKLRRDGMLNLYPFPRVGRSYHTWQVPDFLTESKRQLYAFPRVGRSDLPLIRPETYVGDQLQPSPVRRAEPPGMWFGPRLGRAYKNDRDDMNLESENERSEPEQTDFNQMERKKRQLEP